MSSLIEQLTSLDTSETSSAWDQYRQLLHLESHTAEDVVRIREVARSLAISTQQIAAHLQVIQRWRQLQPEATGLEAANADVAIARQAYTDAVLRHKEAVRAADERLREAQRSKSMAEDAARKIQNADAELNELGEAWSYLLSAEPSPFVAEARQEMESEVRKLEAATTGIEAQQLQSEDPQSLRIMRTRLTKLRMQLSHS